MVQIYYPYIKSSVTGDIKWTLRTTLELIMTPVRTVTCATLRTINGVGRISEFVYFSCLIFFFR